MEKKSFTDKVKDVWAEKPAETTLGVVAALAGVVAIAEGLAGIKSKRAYAKSVKLRAKKA